MTFLLTLTHISQRNPYLDTANNNLAALVQQQAKAKERKEQEARDATVGSLV